MRILHISKKNPYPQKDGESIANTNLAKSLAAEGIEIDLATLNTNKHASNHQTAKAQLSFYSEVHIVDHELTVRPVAALRHLLTDKSYNIERFKSPKFTQLLEDILRRKTYDCIILETIYVLPYLETLKRLTAAVIILRAHNVEHHIWKNKSEQEPNFAKAKYLDQLAKQLQQYQKKNIPLCDGVISVSSIDYEWYKNIVPDKNLCLSPIGIDYHLYQEYKKKGTDFRIGFIGAMDWQPNIQGIQWYVKEVWPIVARHYPQISFHLAGRNMSLDFTDSAVANIVNHGEVEHGIAFIASLDVLVVPLFIGSGIRVKIIEAMAMGKLVLTTTKGLQGILAENGEDLMIADTATAFIKLHDLILTDQSLRNRISSRARRFALEHFDQQSLTKSLIEFINKKIDDKLSLS